MRKEEGYYSTRDLIEKYRVSRYSIAWAITAGLLVVSEKRGRANYFSQQAVDDYIAKSEERFKTKAAE